MVDQKIKSIRLVKIWWTAWFYGVTVWLVCRIFSVGNTSFRVLLKSILQILEETNWYVTAFLGLMIILPILKYVVDKVLKPVLRAIVGIGVGYFVLFRP